MNRAVLPLLVVLAAPALSAGDRAVAQRPQVTFHQQRIVIRVPRMVPPPVAAARWKEGKGPKCLSPRELAGAVIGAPMTVDLLLVDGRRVRAKLGKQCHSAAFYSGLYLKAGPDGQVCADRDAFRIRSGAKCDIKSFRRLSLER